MGAVVASLQKVKGGRGRGGGVRWPKEWEWSRGGVVQAVGDLLEGWQLVAH